MSTQPSFLGFTPWTVDAISWTPIYVSYAFRPDGEAVLENAGSQSINVRTLDTDSTHQRTLLSGEMLTFKTGGFRATGNAPAIPICYAKAVSGIGSLSVIER